jgi:hypothetical protein
MDLGLLPVRLADEAFARERIMRGFGSGEALVEAVQDEVWESGSGEEGAVTQALTDPRLLVHEAEFANVMTVAERRDSSLSGNLRAAWDGVQLANRTKGRRIVANGAHIAIVAGITPTELVSRMSAESVTNGFANRFLHLTIYRSAVLPNPPPIPEGLLSGYVTRFEHALAHGRKRGQRLLARSPEAVARWDDAYRQELSVDRYGLAGDVCARAEAHTLRLSLLFALLDGAERIELVHVEAALALWRYCESSARLIHGRRLGMRYPDKLLAALESAGRNGITREDVGNRVFGKRGAALVDAAVEPLLAAGLIRQHRVASGGRPTTRYVHIESCGDAG